MTDPLPPPPPPPPPPAVVPREEEDAVVGLDRDTEDDDLTTTPLFCGDVALVPVLRRSFLVQRNDCPPSSGSSMTTSSCSLRELQCTYDALVEAGSVDAHTFDPQLYVNLGLVCAVLEQIIDRHTLIGGNGSFSASSSAPHLLPPKDEAARAVVHATYERCQMILNRLLLGAEDRGECSVLKEQENEEEDRSVARSNVAGCRRLDHVRVVEVLPGRYAWLYWCPTTGTTNNMVPSPEVASWDVAVDDDDPVVGLDLLSGLDRRTLADEEAELLAMAYTTIPSELE